MTAVDAAHNTKTFEEIVGYLRKRHPTHKVEEITQIARQIAELNKQFLHSKELYTTKIAKQVPEISKFWTQAERIKETYWPLARNLKAVHPECIPSIKQWLEQVHQFCKEPTKASAEPLLSLERNLKNFFDQPRIQNFLTEHKMKISDPYMSLVADVLAVGGDQQKLVEAHRMTCPLFLEPRTKRATSSASGDGRLVSVAQAQDGTALLDGDRRPSAHHLSESSGESTRDSEAKRRCLFASRFISALHRTVTDAPTLRVTRANASPSVGTQLTARLPMDGPSSAHSSGGTAVTFELSPGAGQPLLPHTLLCAQRLRRVAGNVSVQLPHGESSAPLIVAEGKSLEDRPPLTVAADLASSVSSSLLARVRQMTHLDTELRQVKQQYPQLHVQLRSDKQLTMALESVLELPALLIEVDENYPDSSLHFGFHAKEHPTANAVMECVNNTTAEPVFLGRLAQAFVAAVRKTERELLEPAI